MDHIIDAQGKTLGRLATEIATILQGKKSPTYSPEKVSDDRVLVKNVGGITVTGDKLRGRVYHRHTGYMGHLKDQTLGEKFAKDPKKVLRDTVRHMLPKNFLNQKRLNNLIFVNDAGN
jgi:large subunit ribosomal protein L13